MMPEQNIYFMLLSNYQIMKLSNANLSSIYRFTQSTMLMIIYKNGIKLIMQLFVGKKKLIILI